MSGRSLVDLPAKTAFDVIVVGSGAAGLTAAITAAVHGLSVLVVEKSAQIGGTSAWSGGAAWLPCNPHMAAAGVEDSPEKAARYLRNVVGDRYDAALVGTFLEASGPMVRFLEERTRSVRFQPLGSPDYHPELDGAALTGRSLIPVPFDGRRLGRTLASLKRPLEVLTVFGGMQVDPAEALHLQHSWSRLRSFMVTARLLSRYCADRLRFGRSTRLIRGQALIARLLDSATALQVEFRTECSATGLIRTNGRVTGLEVRDRAQGEGRLRAKAGVVLATGGFSANRQRVEHDLPLPHDHICMLPETNVGDGLAMAHRAGAAEGPVGGDNADNAIWMPASSYRNRHGRLRRYPHFAFDRCKPGSIIVDASGCRFVNEAASYHVVVRAMHARNASPAWLIADHRFLRRYGMGMARPFPYPYRHLVRDGYLIEASDIADLARQTGVDAAGLAESIARMNGFAAAGVDEDFGKGSDIYTRILGDAEHAPNPCLGSIGSAPYYALALYPSDCGTTLGLRVNEKTQVLSIENEAIQGLYACGLDMNSVMRGNYPGAGSMIGPAMVFGYIAGRQLVNRLERQEITDDL